MAEYLQKWQEYMECSSLRMSRPATTTFLQKNTLKLQYWPIFQAYISIIQVNVGSWRKISFDESTRGFKGKHSLKSVIKFKKEGDGYWLGFICDDGFIYTFSLRKNPAPKKLVNKGFCPTQARVLFFFDQLHCKFHIYYIDNLFMSNNICHTLYVDLKAKVKMHGVTISKDRGLPIFFIQQ